MYSVDLFFRVDPELLTITQDFAADKDEFIRVFKKAWTKLANMDRYLEFQYLLYRFSTFYLNNVDMFNHHNTSLFIPLF